MQAKISVKMSKMEKVKTELGKYDYVRFALCDLNGVSRGVVVPSRNAGKYLKDGTDMFQGLLILGSENEIIDLPNEKSKGTGNVTIVPDLDTLRPIPWTAEGKVKVAEMLCESRWREDKSPQRACPRYAARQQLKRLDGLGLQLYSGFEVEHSLFYADTLEPLFQGIHFMEHRNQNKYSSILLDIDNLLLKSYIDIEKSHTEYAPGKYEAIMKPSFGIDSPDTAFNLKEGLKEIADTKGLKTSFASGITSNGTGVSGHFSFSLVSKETGENLFYDASSPDTLSATAKHWIAGVLKHSRALTAFASPTPCCYRRLHRPWAPGSIHWGIEDRAAIIRAKTYSPRDTYLENRVPSGMSNPYLVVASTVAAGLDGLINKLECPAPGPPEKVSLLPKSLPEALQALEEDRGLLDGLGEELVQWFISCKRIDTRKFHNLSDEESLALEKKIFF